jgi:hypothetical protein
MAKSGGNAEVNERGEMGDFLGTERNHNGTGHPRELLTR